MFRSSDLNISHLIMVQQEKVAIPTVEVWDQTPATAQ